MLWRIFSCLVPECLINWRRGCAWGRIAHSSIGRKHIFCPVFDLFEYVDHIKPRTRLRTI